MDDELDAIADRDADLEQTATTIGANQHGEFVQLKHSDRVAVRVEHVGIGDPVLPSARQNHRIHSIKLP